MTRKEEMIAEYESAMNTRLSGRDKELMISVLQWADKTIIEKAAKWIATKLLMPGQDQLLDKFKRAMEE